MSNTVAIYCFFTQSIDNHFFESGTRSLKEALIINTGLTKLDLGSNSKREMLIVIRERTSINHLCIIK